jgi:hypothetical protein
VYKVWAGKFCFQRKKIGPLAHSRASTPAHQATSWARISLGRQCFSPTWVATWPEQQQSLALIGRLCVILGGTKSASASISNPSAHFPLSSFSSRRRNERNEQPVSGEQRWRRCEPLFYLLSRSSLRRARPVKDQQPTSSVAMSPLSVARAHRWVDAPALSGVTVWLTGPTPRRPERVFFLHGTSTTDAWSGPTSRGPERTSAQRQRLGHLPARNGGARQWRLSFYPRASPLQQLELTHQSSKFFPVRGDGRSGRRQRGKPFKP